MNFIRNYIYFNIRIKFNKFINKIRRIKKSIWFVAASTNNYFRNFSSLCILRNLKGYIFPVNCYNFSIIIFGSLYFRVNAAYFPDLMELMVSIYNAVNSALKTFDISLAVFLTFGFDGELERQTKTCSFVREFVSIS